ncbi:telomere repeats-binding bouquet formation protein 1-like isoform X1 [Tachyglossus aculeatus]|uniref:telomere repeats-binding bouquet formation protein 1-like isoform X1 n=1 Tax=Tachyglossus aculeatus TaxID=9261 RepID=UPI0018F3E353|nr:telomere repeats-binding bouquet formation protein 1-like isoform X1 [Tachyglossus aculeatus]XP_038596072.1 telomere repeats-binding bouquet formation protein 1-like isoform X1 [Tachyglossus aculeatus]XP_038596073.1 telomere repeats-binding bouquet formation protein 1-like isoform X1 [Tachyglossus aculeatus]
MGSRNRELTYAEKDVDLLLEYIKRQLNSDNIDALRSVLFSIVSICEENILGNQNLCTPELFDNMAAIIAEEQSSLGLQIASVSLLQGLISNNSAGQTLLRERGCIPVLEKLFREALTKSGIDSLNENRQKRFLWYTVCDTLAAAVSSPKNEENQKACCSILPHVQSLLETCQEPVIIRPVCVTIGCIVKENPLVQEFFISIDGLDVLSDVLTKLVADSRETISSAKMAVLVASVMSISINHNPRGGRILAKHQVVPKLLTLLYVESLDDDETASVLATIGRCIQTCDENLCLLFQNNGLQLIQDSFSASHNEMVNIIVAFVQLRRMLWVKELELRMPIYVLKRISKTIKQRTALGYLKKTEEPFKGQDKEQGPEPDGVAGSDQEKALPKQCSELSAQICHPLANDEFKSQLESPGGDPASTLSGEQEPIESESVFDHAALAVENGAQQPPKEDQPKNP